MSEPLVIHVVNAASSRGDLWAEIKRQNALIHELREAVHAHAQTIRDKQAVIDAERALHVPALALLGPVTVEEWVHAYHVCGSAGYYMDMANVSELLAARRARLLTKEPKS